MPRKLKNMQRWGEDILWEYSVIISDTLKYRNAIFRQQRACVRRFNQRQICRAFPAGNFGSPFHRSLTNAGTSSPLRTSTLQASPCLDSCSTPSLPFAGFAIGTMKFGKRLQGMLEDSLPDWRDHFISYKRLKQSLKRINPTYGNPLCFSQYCSCDGEGYKYTSALPCTPMSGTGSHEQLGSLFCRRLNRPEAEFIALLFSEVNKMNTFFSEKEEDFVIRSQETKSKFDKILKTSNGNLELNPQIIEIRKAIVNIHGEMVLLENYSALNYTGLVKIIKKHDKKTGGNLRMPFVQRVLQEPFFATDIISKLVQECEDMLQLVFPYSNFNICSSEKRDGCINQQDSFPSYFEVSETFVGDDNVERICRNTMAAWRIMREFRKGSSTYNFFSIPPFGFAEYDEGPCCKSIMPEQLCWCAEVPVGPNS